jgi:hypothetical protein
VCEVIFQGDHWITGCGNHDTVRRGNQIALDADINWNLGKTLPPGAAPGLQQSCHAAVGAWL